MTRLLNDRYQLPLAQAIFGTFDEFRDIVQKEVNNIANAQVGGRPSLGKVEFSPWGSQTLAPGPRHNLELVMAQVIERGSAIHGLSQITWSGTVNWTKRPIRGWYGKAYFDSQLPKGHGEIRINCLLDSPDVSTEAVGFLLWHQYLHLFLQSGHTPLFRKLERKWPAYRECERELATLNEKFDFQFFW
jgi:hypothetical protein